MIVFVYASIQPRFVRTTGRSRSTHSFIPTASRPGTAPRFASPRGVEPWGEDTPFGTFETTRGSTGGVATRGSIG